MTERAQKILLVEPDPELLEMLVGTLSLRLDAHITCTANAEGCLDVEMLDPHDLVIAEMELADCRQAVAGSGGLWLAGQLVALNSRPIILLADDPTCDQAIEALRLGVRELLPKPFSMAQLLDATERLLAGFYLRRQHLARYHRMRALVRRVIHERRDLNQRVELICKDLVGAHRRLVHRVLATESSRSTS